MSVYFYSSANELPVDESQPNLSRNHGSKKNKNVKEWSIKVRSTGGLRSSCQSTYPFLIVQFRPLFRRNIFRYSSVLGRRNKSHY